MNTKKVKQHYAMIFKINEKAIRKQLILCCQEQRDAFAQALSEKGEWQVSVLADAKEEAIIFMVNTEGDRHLHKILKGLKRKLQTYGVSQLMINGRLMEEIVEDNQHWLIVTPAQPGEQSIRVKKLIESIRETAYYDISDLYGPEVPFLKKYLMSAKLAVIDWGEKVFLIDQEALQQKINLNCEACTLQHPYGCCCGSPCHYSKKNLTHYKAHEKHILEALKAAEPDRYSAIAQQLTGSPTASCFEMVDFQGTIGECEGRCMLLVRQSGAGRCIVHQYAQRHELPVYELAPLSCLLFPLEIIICYTDKGRKLTLLTSVVSEEAAENLGRWGSYKPLDLTLCCIQEEKHGGLFKKEDYKPVYEVNEKLITHEWEAAFYQALTLAVKDNSI